jgi:hypothetical protein
MNTILAALLVCCHTFFLFFLFFVLNPPFRVSWFGLLPLAQAEQPHCEPFMYPVTEDIAPGYHAVVRCPVDLTSIQVRRGGMRQSLLAFSVV